MIENEDSLLSKQVAPEPKTNRFKMKLAFVAIIFLSFAALVASNAYRYWLAQTSLERYNQAMAARLAAERAEKMADTYGGKTPAETLSLYIEAVKKGDYELASKYLISSKRDDEINFWKIVKPDNLAAVIKNIEGDLGKEGSYSLDKTLFTIDRPITIDFELYPNGIWKITEI